MKIENSTNVLPASTTNEANTRAVMAKNAEAAKPVVAEQMGTSVSLGASAQLRSVGGNADAPQVDANKVAEIKKAIAEGRFQVNSGIVADRLLSSVRDLIGTNQH